MSYHLLLLFFLLQKKSSRSSSKSRISSISSQSSESQDSCNLDEDGYLTELKIVEDDPAQLYAYLGTRNSVVSTTESLSVILDRIK